MPAPKFKGRGVPVQPKNRYDSQEIIYDENGWETANLKKVPAQFIPDHSKTILARNDSPDVSFTYSLNPYRGCEHGCIYCYARPTHEQLGFSAGLDFETKIIVKHNAPQLLAETLRRKSWQPQVVALSGNTDCYQPIERELRLTRDCLKVFLKYRNPVSIITKNALVLRDLDLLRQLAALNLVSVRISITTMNNRLSRILEPRTAAPAKRLQVIQQLAQSGVPVGVLVAPVIPALNENEIPEILRRAADAGATQATYILLRLPHSLKEIFQQWLAHYFPDRAKKILHALESMRDGKLYQCTFRDRQKGHGPRAQLLQSLFEVSCAKYGLNDRPVQLSTAHFCRTPQQLSLLDPA